MSVSPLHSRLDSRRGHNRSAPQHQPSATPAVLKVPHYLASLAARVHDFWRHGAAVATLGAMSDSQLRDTGVNRADIRSFVSERHHERARGYVDWRRHDPRY
jgi:uncharacterized protein YjiS (DUF1127 family)